jgi:hypothetical protein
VDRCGTDKRARRRHTSVRHMGTRAHRCSPVVAEEDEMDEAVPEGCSPEHERRRLELGVRTKEGTRELGREGKRGSEGWGFSLPFMGSEGAPGRGGRGW